MSERRLTDEMACDAIMEQAGEIENLCPNGCYITVIDPWSPFIGGNRRNEHRYLFDEPIGPLSHVRREACQVVSTFWADIGWTLGMTSKQFRESHPLSRQALGDEPMPIPGGMGEATQVCGKGLVVSVAGGTSEQNTDVCDLVHNLLLTVARVL